MVITMLMTIASMLKVVFGPSENGFFAAEAPTASVRTNYKRLKCPSRMRKHPKCIFIYCQKIFYDMD